MKKTLPALFLAAFSFGLVSCDTSNMDIDTTYPEKTTMKGNYKSGNEVPDGLFGKGGLTFGGEEDTASSGVGVNSYLWRASLDTISFIPLVSADPFGGLIVTEWYSPENVSTERFKLNVIVLSSALRADGIKVTSFRQVKSKNGAWTDAPADEAIATKIEDAILTRARELRSSRN